MMRRHKSRRSAAYEPVAASASPSHAVYATDYLEPLGAYEEASTPPPSSSSVGRLGARRSQPRSSGHSMKSGSIRHTHAAPPASGGLQGFHGRLLRGTQGLSKKAVQALQVMADVFFAVCLLASFLVRVNLVSLYYLLVFCFGVIHSFESKAITLLTLTVSLVACIGHVVVIVTNGSIGGEHVLSLFGLKRASNTKDYVLGIGIDALVVCCSAIHAFYVLRKLHVHRQRFDLFEMGENIVNQNIQNRNRATSLAKYVELLTAIALFVTSISIPAFATGLFYLIFLQRLIQWTFCAKQVSVENLMFDDYPVTFFIGSFVARALLALSVLVLLALYGFQFDDVHGNKTLNTVGEYLGFANFQNGAVAWEYYVFLATLFLLFVCSAKLFNLHKEVAKELELFHLSSPSHSVPRLTDPTVVPSEDDPEQSERSASSTVDVEAMLKKQPFFVRLFIREGGLLLASAAAIFWSVSYPSYASAPLFGWSLITLFLYGLSSPSIVVWILVVYGTMLAVAEYTSNLTVDLIQDDYTKYGLKVFEYPLLDIGVHNVCLFFMYFSVRTRWRFRSLIIESRKQNEQKKLQQARSAESSSYRLGENIRLQLRTGWRQTVEMWIDDAKGVILTHMDALVLLTILAVVLSTKVSFLQIGYLVIAVFLMLFFKHRRRFWRALLVYAICACYAVFMRNIDCKPDDRLDLIGLPCYNPSAFTWGSLWPTLFSAHLLIICQLVFQLVIYVTNKDTIDERMRTMAMARQNPIFFISRLAVEVDNLFRMGGVVVCYVAYLVVAYQFERGANSRHTNVIGGIHIALLFFLLGNHMGSFRRAPRTSLWLKIVWLFALVVEVLILILRYVYQFTQVSTYLETHVFTASFMSSTDFGLENRSSKTHLSNVFFYLLPTAIIMALTFWQIVSLMGEVHPYNFFAVGRSTMVDRLRFFFDTIMKLVISFSTSACLLTTMAAAIDDVNGVGLLYVLILVIGRALCSWRYLWRPIFWVSALDLLVKYIYQLSIFDKNSDGPGGLKDLRSGSTSDWLGIDRAVELEGSRSSGMWKLTQWQLVLILLCCFQRMSQYFDKPRKQEDQEFLGPQGADDFAFQLQGMDKRPRSSSCSANDGDDRNSATLIPSDQERSHGSQVVASDGRQRDDTNVQRAFSESGSVVEVDFFSCLRDFCVDYASKASVNVTMLILMISAFVHQDAISLVYMVVIYSMMYAAASTVCKRWWCLAIMVSIFMIAEYAVALWLPPFLNIEMQDLPPWNAVPQTHQQWLVLSNQNLWALFVDFIGLMSIYLLPDSQKISSDSSGTAGDQAPESKGMQDWDDIERSKYSMVLHTPDPNVAQTPVPIAPPKERELIILSQKYLWYYLVVVFVSSWLLVLLITVFVFGAEQGGLISLVYVGASVFMLYRFEESRQPSSPWIQYLRKFNWAHLFAMLILRAPYVSDHVDACTSGGTSVISSSKNVGGSVVQNNCMSAANVLGLDISSVPYGLITIFVMISIHCEILLTPAHDDVCEHANDQLRMAPYRRQEIIRDYFKNRTAQWFRLKREKSSAIQRLKIIVSKLVHKVEELMDIAMGLHYNLPPLAPPQPSFEGCTQNSITISWQPPRDSVHKIRFYRISRQRYPSMTLLGEFGDIVEVKGDHTQATIEGLRPGTTYQFKVCAVSRMGEGPFSVASEPMATQPLNLDGSCTAGWMKYRREHLPTPRFGFLLAWFQPSFLVRYVVMDATRLVYYKDEEVALRHRSKRRRKKVKTSFRWRDVLSLKLSEDKVQYDDMSPLLYCFEIVVQQEGVEGSVKYVFQADASKEYNKFLSALAFSVPKDTLDESILDCLAERNLPSPLDVVPDGGPDSGEQNEAYDESKSDWSSVTDESTIADAEDAEFDQSPRGFFSWRIPLYRLFHGLQDAALQRETEVYEHDDPVDPGIGEIVVVFTNAIRSHTAFYCYMAMIAGFAFQGDLMNMVYAITAFCYMVLENPRPRAGAWKFVLQYSCAIIAIRYLFQLTLFCNNLSANGYYYPSIQPYCYSAAGTLTTPVPIQPLVLFGLYKFNGAALPGVTSIYSGLQWNFYVVVFVLWHRREMMLRGLWKGGSGGEPTSEAARINSDVVGGLRGSVQSSADSIDESFNFNGHGDRLPPAYVSSQSAGQGDASSEPISGGEIVMLRSAPSSGSAERGSSHSVENALAAEMLEEIQEEEQQIEAERRAAATGEDALQRSSSASMVHADAHDATVKQVEIDESVDTEHIRKRESWWETKWPAGYAYFTSILTRAPANWDKDIHAAIAGEKPGRDYYAVSLTIQLFSSIYAVIFFKMIGEPDPNDKSGANANRPISSSSMLSGYLVLVVFTELCFIIWDRVAYVCGSLRSKLVLQYSFSFLLHLCVWYLLPNHTYAYFQKRAGLVLFYLFHCAYLYCGALQIRYGYPVFRGSKYNYTTHTFYTKVSEKVFPLVMLAPFLFEMRALLDYVCTKTSLSWAHWVLLEDTAAHLFQVKMEMQGRVEDAVVLQGNKRQPIARKMSTAGLMLLVLLICLVGPLALFSSANPSTAANDVTLTDVTFGVQDSRGSLNQLYINSDINSPRYKSAQKNTEGSSVQRIAFDTYSRDVWSISPPHVSQLVKQLQSNESLNWTMSFSFQRPGPTDHQTVKVDYKVPLNATYRQQLIAAINVTNNKSDDEVTSTPIRIDRVYPAIIQLPATEDARARSPFMRTVNLTKHMLKDATWWSVEPLVHNVDLSGQKVECEAANPFCIIAVSDNIVQGLNSLGIGSYGITAVYVFVIVTIGSAVKGFFRGNLFQIQYSELPDPEDVLELIEGIYIAREERYVGHLKDEVRIFETLIRVLRSPETMAKVTGTNVIHIPAAKEKID